MQRVWVCHTLLDILPLYLSDAPPNSLVDSNANPKMKTTKGVRVRSFVQSTLGVKGRVEALGWRL